MPQQDQTHARPPFARQQQPWRGLACEMQLPPDRNVCGSTGGETGP